MTVDRSTRVGRSVDALGRLYSVVVGLAVTLAVQRILFGDTARMLPWQEFIESIPVWAPGMIAFIFTIVPFYHGMNRHLDIVYVESDSSPQGLIVIDFFVFFIESCLLVAFASLVGADEAFLILAALLLFDAGWAVAAGAMHYRKAKPSTYRWALINVIAATALWAVYHQQVFEKGHSTAWALCAVALLRTLADYLSTKELYFPE